MAWSSLQRLNACNYFVKNIGFYRCCINGFADNINLNWGCIVLSCPCINSVQIVLEVRHSLQFSVQKVNSQRLLQFMVIKDELVISVWWLWVYDHKKYKQIEDRSSCYLLAGTESLAKDWKTIRLGSNRVNFAPWITYGFVATFTNVLYTSNDIVNL